KIQVSGKLQLLHEDFALDLARREVIVIVEADFSDRHNLVVSRKRAEIVERLRSNLRSLVWVDSDGGIDAGVSVSEFHCITGADGRDACDSCRGCAVENGIEILGKTRVVEMTVRVDKHLYFRRAPTGTSSRKPARIGLPPSSDAATIMPFDSMPRSLRGCRLA